MTIMGGYVRIVKTLDSKIGSIGIYSVDEWWKMEFLLHIDYPGGAGAAQDESHSSVLELFKRLQNCSGELT